MSDHDVLPQPLCRLDELALRGSKGVHYQGQSLFLVRQGEHIYLYENRCPHRGISLEWVPDQFLDSSARLIQCATHGALFLPENGECVAGPCVGQSLRQLRCHVSNGHVWLGDGQPS